jgi:4-hydroxybenzoate polyprenyltransferase
MSVSVESWQTVHWVVAAGIGVYIAGVTLFARSEARISARAQLALGAAVLVAGIALVASTPEWIQGDEWPLWTVPERWYIFWGLMGLWIAGRCVRAIATPAPMYVQLAVKNCIFALVILDAYTVLLVQDVAWAIVILALLVPTLLLGRFIYAT